MASYPKYQYPKQGQIPQDNQRASINSDEADLRSFPANSLGMASFFGSAQIHQMGENAKAIVLGASGETLDTDLTVTGGHRHNTQHSRLRWQQLATFPFVNSSESGDDIEDALCIRATAANITVALKLWIPFEDSKHIIPRFRVSVAPAPSAVVMANLVLNYYDQGGALLETTAPLTISTSRAIDREWFECPPINLSAADADATFTDMLSVWAELTTTMGAITEFVYIHELSFGVYDL